MNRRQLKQHIVSILSTEKLPAITELLLAYDQKYLINPLISCLCSTDEVVRWHSVSAIGQVINTIAAREIEDARLVMRRFLWMLNDESGGIGWGVPEAMSEAMYHNKRLAEEYMHMLVSYSQGDGPELFQDGNFIELPLLQHGVLWGLCRLARKYSEQLVEKGAHECFGFYLASKDSQVRGLAALLCGLLERREFISVLQTLADDQEMLKFYRDGQIEKYSVGTIASGALRAFSGNRDRCGISSD